MASEEEVWKKYWSLPEPEVQEMPTRRCKACSKITYVNFRAGSVMDEWFHPRTLVIGDFAYVVKSAFAGCHVCRIIMIHILQSFMHLAQTITCYNIIKKVGLRLSLDDELSLHCWDGEGRSVQLSDLAVTGVIDLEDEQPAEPGDQAEQLEDEQKLLGGLYWERDESTGLVRLLERDENRLHLNPSIEIHPLLLHHWLNNCTSNHPLCRSKATTKLPTRILDVGESMDSHRSRLFVTNGLEAPYLTLSHCWGVSHNSITLNHSNFDSFVAGVDDTEMPKTFHEAIMMTRNLGTRYLWIDSMCIIQPTTTDKDDWNREGARMGEYYSGSLLNLSASAGLNSMEGLLHARPGSQFDVEPFPLFEKVVHREWGEFAKSMGRSPNWFPIMQPKPASWLQHVQRSPLSSRAWVLQERLLAPRTLHCTMQGFFWECSELRASEYEPLGVRPDYFIRDHGLLSLNKLKAKENSFITGSYWRHVVENFSSLQITFPSDRLPALAGLARTIQEHAKDTYIAGHFKSSLVSSLLWFKLDSGTPGVQARNSGAPSWSWASTPGQVKFTRLELEDYPSRDPKEYGWKAELLHISAEPVSMNPYGWLSHSSLKLRGYLKERSSESEFPEVVGENRTVQEQWLGHVPMPKEDSIPQAGTIFIDREGMLEDLVKPEADDELQAPMPHADNKPQELEEHFEGLSTDDRSKGEDIEHQEVASFDKTPAANAPVVSDPQATETSDEEHTGVAHNATCDGCGKGIFGIRHKCLDCPDFDYCSKCIVDASRTHPDHHFEQLSDPRAHTASITAKQSLLQATIKEQMQAMKNSQQWKDMQQELERESEAEKDRVEPINVILDFPDEEYTEDEFVLFLVMSSHERKFHEGLVLVRDDDKARFRRVGFFSTKLESAFDGAELVEVELV